MTLGAADIKRKLDYATPTYTKLKPDTMQDLSKRLTCYLSHQRPSENMLLIQRIHTNQHNHKILSIAR